MSKNIFVMPTIEPSYVYLVKKINALALTSKDPDAMEQYGSGTHNQQVYITNKDFYDRGDWCIDIESEEIFKVAEVKEVSGIVRSDTDTYVYDACAKIVLTTDLKLVADGVKEVDQNFLDWFVDFRLGEMNSVEVEKIPLLSNNGRALYGFNYKILIPTNEDPKKHTVILAGEDAVKEERERGLIITHINKKETLQEVAERILANNIIGLKDALKDDDLFLFYKGVILCYGQAMAEWQRETCIQCDGTGETTTSQNYDSQRVCNLCGGKGYCNKKVVNKDINQSETPMKSLLDFVNKIKINLSNKDELNTLQFIIDTIKNEYIDKENKLLLQKKYSSQEVEEMLRCYGIDICSKVMGEPMIGNLNPKEWLVNYNLKK